MHKNKKTAPTSAGHAGRLPTLNVSAHAGQRVACHPQTLKIIGHGASPVDALHGVAKLKGVEPVLYYVPKSDAFFVGPGT